MYYTLYILKSQRFNKFYTGQTDNLERRIKEHNSGKVKYTTLYMPWMLIYKEVFKNREDTVKREKYLKSAAGRRWLKKKFKYN